MTWLPPTIDKTLVCPFCGHEQQPDRRFPHRLVHVIDPNQYWTRCPAPGAKASPEGRIETISKPQWAISKGL